MSKTAQELADEAKRLFREAMHISAHDSPIHSDSSRNARMERVVQSTNAVDTAIDALLSLAQASQARTDGGAADWSVERHGNGWAIYRGRDMNHHGWNQGQLTECYDKLPALIERALNATPPGNATQAADRSRAVRFLPIADGRLIEDDDFTYDALFKIIGDFGDDATRLAYAQSICDTLNAHGIASPAAELKKD